MIDKIVSRKKMRKVLYFLLQSSGYHANGKGEEKNG